MPEKAISQRMNAAKKTACAILIKAEYQIEPAGNKTFCITAARKPEQRLIAIGLKEILSCQWFKDQIKRLEKWPNPAPSVISKEVWIKEKGEHNFVCYHYEDGRWFDKNFDPVGIFDN